ncbi:carbamoyl-phosphate synthase L chain, ATP binding domain-containing protein [Halteromyces radiatus]|uniref:carbamoyl-phosphate synthase L chain, ATP binding domain-containing protein n=1 Tax=Halteromyces radiatus TaxID=101107 RepID=UPI00221EBC74|nr:carbamoyl-phosphate synthase L chain, ATP binding domain-containing protein [Halteromyces radiatus]KAI8099673.1 carbamoyl-phosphate synthase L chain, ATP binding domain-containing protein [Halteromyces radiatus]
MFRLYKTLASPPVRVRATLPSLTCTKLYYSSQPERNALFEKVLIANRGEIACRVMRTAKKLGIKTVAVYSEADVHAQHVKMADEAYLIGPAPSAQSYLDINKILDVARLTGSQAIHPGYGFLSENADFADRVTNEKIAFIGPSGDAMRSMGSKSESKFIMEKAGVPVVPGYHGENQDVGFLKEQAEKIGYPVLIKAVKGGGGKGMRIVRHAGEFEEMLESSRRESIKSFGDDKVLVEKYLEHPRHVEVQVFADKHDNVVHLFERDCSVQRRHQKVIEEAPAPGLSEEIRALLGAKAVAAARAVGYENAGTVEFIMDNIDKQFYFMEMNTRLQVEHPVTEMVTNTDLVHWQFEVASGNRLLLNQDQLKLSGHAFEARVYAENPLNNFLPDTGPLFNVRTPATSEDLRLETGFVQGDQISVHYDPMISKLIVRGEDRNDALRRFRRALEEYQVVGLTTNIDFIKKVAEHPEFIKGEVETGFIQQFEKDLLKAPEAPNPETLALAATALRLQEIRQLKFNKQDPQSPWQSLDRPLRLNNMETTKTTLQSHDGESYDVYMTTSAKADDKSPHLVDVEIKQSGSTDIIKKYEAVDSYLDEEGLVISSLDNKKVKSNVVLHNDDVIIFDEFGRTNMKLPTPAYVAGGVSGADGAGSVKTPMPCKISQVMIKPGQKVEKGDAIIVLEAMKMEHVIRAPMDGVVDQVLYNVGDLVEENKSLVMFAE